jgi:hypothetical protein
MFNKKVRVKETSPFHSGRVGYVYFYGEGESDGTVVLATEPVKPSSKKVLFAVAVEHIEECVE